MYVNTKILWLFALCLLKIQASELCVWVSGNYGEIAHCASSYYQQGICSSGYAADCPDWNNPNLLPYSFFQAKCCYRSDYQDSVENCTVLSGQYGQNLSCQPGQIAVGGCGSGEMNDCSHTGSPNWSELVCCNKPNTKILAKNCYKKYGEFGLENSCQANEVVVSICGSGSNPDCNGHGNMIECCPLV